MWPQHVRRTEGDSDFGGGVTTLDYLNDGGNYPADGFEDLHIPGAHIPFKLSPTFYTSQHELPFVPKHKEGAFDFASGIDGADATYGDATAGTSTLQDIGPSSFYPSNQPGDDEENDIALSSDWVPPEFGNHPTSNPNVIPTIHIDSLLPQFAAPSRQAQGSDIQFPDRHRSLLRGGLLTPPVTSAGEASRSPSPLENPSPLKIPMLTRRRRTRSSPGPSSVICSMCHQRFSNRKGLMSHRNYDHGSEQAKELIAGRLQYYEEGASVLRVMACTLNTLADQPLLRATLKDAVRALGENQDLSSAQTVRFEAAFLEFAKWWVSRLKCDGCGITFSRRDAMIRHIRQLSCDGHDQL